MSEYCRRVIPGTEVEILSKKILVLRQTAQINEFHAQTPPTGRFCLRMICCTEGVGRHVVANQCINLHKGDILIIPTNIKYRPLATETDCADEIIVLMCPSFLNAMTTIHTDLLRGLNQRMVEKDYVFKPSKNGRQNMVQAFETIYQEYSTRNAGWDMVSYATVACILATVFRPKVVADAPSMDDRELLYSKIIPFIEHNFDVPLTLEDIARLFLIGTSKLCKLFRKYEGISCYQYLIRYRLAVAQIYLLDGIPPKQVWQMCGFSDYSSFYRHYKKTFHVSPSKFLQIAPEPTTAFGTNCICVTSLRK